MYRVLITDVSTPILQDGLTQLGFEVINKPDIDQAYVENNIQDYDGIIVRSKITLFAGTLQKAKRLKFIGRPGSGLDLIDLDYCGQNGIVVCRSATSNSNAVAEHALGMILAWMNKLVIANNEVKNMIWKREENRGFEIMGKTIGIIGFGNTGSRFAKKLLGLDVKVLAFDKYKVDYTEDFPHVRESTLEEVCKSVDILSFHLPLNKETRHYLNTDFIASFRKPVLIVNTSRGPIVDTLALVKGLDEGLLSGACLDVLENEEPSKYTDIEQDMYQNLFLRENVILSPHIAGWSDKSKIQMESFLLDSIENKVLR